MLAEELSASTAALKRSEESFRSLIERSPDAIIVHREDTLVYANAAALTLLGVRDVSALAAAGIPAVLQLDASSGPGAGPSAARPESTQRDGQLTRRDGSKLDVDVASIPVNFDGQAATLSIARDISARKELTARAMEMDRMIAVGTLAAGVGHEINTPLAYVDAVLCDLMMPEMTGVDFHDELERRMPDLAQRVLFFTGGAFTPATRAFVRRMAHRCLEKPLNLVELRRKLAELGLHD